MSSTDVTPALDATPWDDDVALQHSILRTLPLEALVRIALFSSDTVVELLGLAAICYKFKHTIVPMALEFAVDKFLLGFEIARPRPFLRKVRCVKGLISGPSLLATLFPSVRQTLLETGMPLRLEIHVPGTREAVVLLCQELVTAGYQLVDDLNSNYKCFDFARTHLRYATYGRTVHQMFNFRRMSPTLGSTVECTVVVNKSSESALPSILEMPNTALMNYLFDYRIRILYPALTLNARGLSNYHVQMRPPAPANTWDTLLRDSGFSVSACLNDFLPYQDHPCGTTPSCPLTQRREWDDHTSVLSFGHHAVGDRGVPYTYVSWALKSATSCNVSSSNVYLPTDYTIGRYVVHRSIYEDTFTWWTTGDEDGHGRYKYEHFSERYPLATDDLAASRLRHIERMEHSPPLFRSDHMVPRLPNELYERILWMLGDGPELDIAFDEPLDNIPFRDTLPSFPQGRTTLATSCPLVCRSFRDLVTRRVWEYVRIRSENDLESLFSLYEDQEDESCVWTRRTQRLDVCIRENAPSPNNPLHRYDAERLATLIRSMPALEILAFNNSFPQIAPKSFRFLSPCVVDAIRACPRLKRLQFVNPVEVIEYSSLVDISRACRELQCLQLANIFNEDDEDDENDSVDDDFSGDDGSEKSDGVIPLEHGPDVSFAQSAHSVQATVPLQDDVEELRCLSFPALLWLVVGTGDVNGCGYEALHLVDFLKDDLAPDLSNIAPSLTRVDLLVDAMADEDLVTAYRDHIHTTVIVYSGDPPHVDLTYLTRLPRLHHLLVVLQTGDADLPAPLHSVQRLDVFQGCERGGRDSRARLHEVNCVTNAFLHSWISRLDSPGKSVALWCSPEVDPTCFCQFTSLFRLHGIHFEVRTLQKYIFESPSRQYRLGLLQP